MASPWPAIARKLGTARRQRWPVLALAPVAWAAIGIAAALILLLPFRRMAPWLGRNAGAVALVPLAGPRAAARARTIAAAIDLAARNAPFRSNCLPQALAAVALGRLAGLPSALHLGALVDTGGPARRMKAHAWVECGPVTVTGGANSPKRYAAVACFVHGA